jgi:DNA polymerase-3 subunit alpha
MFDIFETAPKPPKKAGSVVQPWSQGEKLAFEKELLGFYITGHPLDEYRSVLESGKYIPIASLAEQADKSTVTLAGALASVERKFTKKESKPFAIVTLEDLTGSLEVMIWNETFNKTQSLLVQGEVVSITGRLDQREEGPRLTANEVKPVKKMEVMEKPLVLTLDRAKAKPRDLDEIRDIIWQNPGNRRVKLRVIGGEEDALWIVPSDEFRINKDAEGKLAAWVVAK